MFFGRNQTQPDHHNGVSPILCLYINMILGIISFTVSSKYGLRFLIIWLHILRQDNNYQFRSDLIY